MSIPAVVEEGELRTYGGDVEMIRTYYLPDSSCFIMLEISKPEKENIEELLETEKIELPFDYVNSLLVSTYVDNVSDIRHVGIEYRSNESGENVNSITIYSVHGFMVKISIRFLGSYNSVLGRNRDVMRYITGSLREI